MCIVSSRDRRLSKRSAGVSRIATVSLELDELRLVAAAKAGDKDAYMQLVRRHQVAVFHAAYLLTESAAQAETVTLQAFVQAWGSLRRRPVTVPFGEWVLALVAPEARGTPRVGGDPWAAPDVSGAVLAALDDQSRRRSPRQHCGNRRDRRDRGRSGDPGAESHDRQSPGRQCPPDVTHTAGRRRALSARPADPAGRGSPRGRVHGADATDARRRVPRPRRRRAAGSRCSPAAC